MPSRKYQLRPGTEIGCIEPVTPNVNGHCLAYCRAILQPELEAPVLTPCGKILKYLFITHVHSGIKNKYLFDRTTLIYLNYITLHLLTKKEVRMKKIVAKISFVFLLTVSASATIYTCYNGSCLTTINDAGDGFSWAIACEDGSYASGHTAGAAYGGGCKAIM